MLTKIRYAITNAAQRAEIAAGREGGIYREVEVDLSTHALESWIEVDSDGALSTIYREGKAAINRNTIAAPQETLPSADQAADILAAEMRAYLALRSQTIAAWLALPDEDRIYRYHGLREVDWCVKEPDYIDKNVSAEIDRLGKICTARDATERAAIEARREKDEAEKAAVEAAKLTQLAEAVQRLGTQVQKDKWAAGLMANREALDLIAADYFRLVPLAGFTLLPNGAQLGDDGELTEKGTLTDAQFVTRQKIAALLPDATIEAQHETGTDPDSGEDTECDYLKISKTIGLYTVARKVTI